MLRSIFLVCVSLIILPTQGWVSSPLSSSSLTTTSFTRRNNSHLGMVQSILLGGEESQLSKDHDQVGEELSGSVQRWLDAEWMPQDVHKQIGDSCKNTYVACREDGKDNMMDIMMQVADDLQADWQQKYDKDAFVNAWDVSNYVSDYLTAKSGIEGCECSTKPY